MNKRIPLTKIILPNMHTLAPNRQRNIYTVVNQQRHIIPPGNLVQPAAGRHERACVAGLVAVLDACDAALERRLDHLPYIRVPKDRRRRVRHEVQRVVNLAFRHLYFSFLVRVNRRKDLRLKNYTAYKIAP